MLRTPKPSKKPKRMSTLTYLAKWISRNLRYLPTTERGVIKLVMVYFDTDRYKVTLTDSEVDTV